MIAKAPKELRSIADWNSESISNAGKKGGKILMYNPQLETFLCVAECGSFNKAAERLYISPPAVIKQINLLEESLNLQLFIRTHRGLQLTEAGKSLGTENESTHH